MKATVTRFRIMAIISGVMSLLLWFVYLPIRHHWFGLFAENTGPGEKIIWIAIVHGYLYPLYVLSAVNFGFKAKWPLPKMLLLILAGTLPVASLWAERRVVRTYK